MNDSFLVNFFVFRIALRATINLFLFISQMEIKLIISLKKIKKSENKIIRKRRGNEFAHVMTFTFGKEKRKMFSTENSKLDHSKLFGFVFRHLIQDPFN